MKTNNAIISNGPKRVRISRIVDCSKESMYPTTRKATKPFVVLFEVDEYEFALINQDGGNHTKGFATKEEAFHAGVEFLLHFKYDAVIVTKNADFTEGRGPMLFHRLFKSVKKAEEYVSRQNGIYGSKQHRHIQFGMNINGDGYAYPYWSGYEIELVSFDD